MLETQPPKTMNRETQGPEGERIQNLFSGIASTYDKANTFITFGMDRSWRKQLVDWSDVPNDGAVLDVATGTGDLLFEFARKMSPTSKLIGVDFCQEMLDQAPLKTKEFPHEMEFRWADAQALPYPDETFDVVSIAYGIRNIRNPEVAIREMARVLKKKGSLMILETGQNQLPLIQKAFDLYFKKVVPRIGGFISGRKEAYEYLSTSSKAFPCREQFIELLKDSFDFQTTEFRTLMGGASFIYKATKSLA